MANTCKINGVNGISYQIIGAHRRDTNGKQVRHYQTFTPSPGMTARQTEKALNAATV
ncbi:MAG: hypothetical protein FWC73_11850 [Defluviitaleaceae bacterium]|nr:hypothetical protein [Defluviitaleaceae bacterium]